MAAIVSSAACLANEDVPVACLREADWARLAGWQRPRAVVRTYLYGRLMYETMAYWETAHTLTDQPPFIRDYAKIWQAADKLVYSRTNPERGVQRQHTDRAISRVIRT